MDKRYSTGTIIIDDNELIVSASPYIYHLTNRDDEDILSKPLDEIFDQEDHSLVQLNGARIPVFYEKSSIAVNSSIATMYLIWSEDIVLETHPIYKTITSEINDMVTVIDTSANILFTTPSYQTYLGLTPPSLENKCFLDLVDQEDKQHVSKLIKKIKSDKEETNFRIMGRNNTLVVKATFSPIIGNNGTISYIVIIARDLQITDKDISNIVEREQRYKSLFDQNPDFVFSLDLDTCFSDINDAMLDATGFTKAEILERPFSTIITPDNFSQAVTSLINVKKGVKTTYDTTIIKKQGSPIFVSLSLFPIFVHNQLAGIHGIAKDMSKKKEYERRIYALAYTDTLTNLPNRASFHREIDETLKYSEKHNKKFALMFFDLDNFKGVNDSLGHNAGDDLLRQISKRVRDSLPENCTLYRMGGDEFTVIVSHYKSKYELQGIANIIQDCFKTPVFIGSHEILTSSSVGIATYPKDAENTGDLTRFADTAMYHCKQKRKNSYTFFTESMNAHQSKEFYLSGNLRKALENEEFELYYQPIVDVTTGKVSSCEALIRWNSKEQGIISPGVFIPIAEVSGLIHDLGDWVIKESCRQLKEWLSKGLCAVPISINVSSKQFERQNLYKNLNKTIRKYGLDPKFLTIEVTESIAMKRRQHVLGVLKKVKEIGCNLAIDDFGSGYSSFAYLKDFPIDKLKIDKSFVDSIVEDEKIKQIVKIIVDLGHVLELEVIAEGVELEEEQGILKEFGIDGIQGYLYSKPLPAQEFEDKYLK